MHCTNGPLVGILLALPFVAFILGLLCGVSAPRQT